MAFKDFFINYDIENKIIISKIINKYAVLNDPTLFIESNEYIHKLLIENKCNKILADYSLIGINMTFDMEYYYAKNINKVFGYNESIIRAYYEGSHYNEKKWKLIKNIFNQDGVTNVDIFDDYDKAMAWLKSK